MYKNERRVCLTLSRTSGHPVDACMDPCMHAGKCICLVPQGLVGKVALLPAVAYNAGKIADV